MSFSSARGWFRPRSSPRVASATPPEAPVVLLQGHTVLGGEGDAGDGIDRGVLVLSPPVSGEPVVHSERRLVEVHNGQKTSAVQLVRYIWLAEEADINRLNYEQGEEDAVCPICLDPVYARHALVTSCKHVFHLDCCRRSERSDYSIIKTGRWACPCCREVLCTVIIGSKESAPTQSHPAVGTSHAIPGNHPPLTPPMAQTPTDSALGTSDATPANHPPLTPPLTLSDLVFRGGSGATGPDDEGMESDAAAISMVDDEGMDSDAAAVSIVRFDPQAAQSPREGRSAEGGRRQSFAYDILTQTVIQRLVFGHDFVIGSRQEHVCLPGVLGMTVDWDQLRSRLEADMGLTHEQSLAVRLQRLQVQSSRWMMACFGFALILAVSSAIGVRCTMGRC